MVTRLPDDWRRGGKVTCLAAECLTYFFSSRRQPDDDLFSFPRRYSPSERRVMAKGCGFIFYQLKKRTKSFSTPYNAYNTYIHYRIEHTYYYRFPHELLLRYTPLLYDTNPLIFILRSQIQVSLTSFSLLFSIYYIHCIL